MPSVDSPSRDFERRDDCRMQALALASKQARRGCVLDERVLENVARPRRETALEHQPGFDQLRERALQRGIRQRADRREQLVRKLPADHRADLRHLARRRQTIQPGHQRILERHWHRDGRQSSGDDVGVAFETQQAQLEQGLGQFLHEQRHAVGLGDHRIENTRRQPAAMCDPLDHLSALLASQPVQRQLQHVRASGATGTFAPAEM